jgi:site-specific recombinase XerD
LNHDNFKRQYWGPLMELLGMKHIPYETRHTCATMLHAAGVDETTRKYILGHKGKMDLTERVYTHLEIKQLVDAINKI